MTVNYLDQVATVGFSLRLLKQWRGSLQKAIWEDLTIFLALFFSISLSYRFVISRDNLVDPEYKAWFDRLCVYCRESRKLIPISFLLGFYITMVVQRWWEQLCCLASPDALAVHLAAYIPGSGSAREVRRTIVRWACLSTVLTLRKVSGKVLHRFPEYRHLVHAEMLTEREEVKLLILDEKTNGRYCNHLHPIKWAKVMLRKAYQKGLIVGNNDNLLNSLSNDCTDIYTKNFQLLRYSSVPIPLLYTQVIIIAVYTYFLACIFGQQHITGDHENDKDAVPDMYIPIFTILEFIFYVGWLKVGSALINPFGDDDDDFDMDDLIDRNLEMGLLLVEEEDIQLDETPLRRRRNSAGRVSFTLTQVPPSILVSAEWWEGNGMLEIEGVQEREAVSSIVSSENAARLIDPKENAVRVTVTGENIVRLRDTEQNADRLTVPGQNTDRLTVPKENTDRLTDSGQNIEGKNTDSLTVLAENAVKSTTPGENITRLADTGQNAANLTVTGQNTDRLEVPRENNDRLLRQIEGIRQRTPGSSINDIGSSF